MKHSASESKPVAEPKITHSRQTSQQQPNFLQQVFYQPNGEGDDQGGNEQASAAEAAYINNLADF